MASRRPRGNPLTFDNRVPLTPQLRERIRTTKSRVVASLLSTAKHRAIEQATINSPHNFLIVVSPGTLGVDAGKTSLSHADAVTLVVSVGPDADAWFSIEARPETSRSDRFSVMSAFMYLHRLGDVLLEDPFLPLTLIVFAEEPVPFSDVVRFLEDAAGVPKAPLRRRAERMYRAIRNCGEAYQRHTQGNKHRQRVVLDYVVTHINSKMVREGYASDELQSLADLIPLCEFTPASRPLFLPLDPSRMKSRTSSADAAMCDAYGEEMNVLFRAFYNAFVPALYGAVFSI